MAKEKKPSVLMNFGIGGVTGMIATFCTQPLDYIKVHLQLKGEGVRGVRVDPFLIYRETVQAYGFRHLFIGLDSALLRQATYTSARLGIYKTLIDNAESRKGSVPIWEKSIYSLVAGGIGAIIGNPCDLALVRMQSDLTLPLDRRRNYSGVINALSRTINEEGLLALWKGSAPTMGRAMSLNFGMLTTYDSLKETLVDMFGEFNGIRVLCSFSASFVACVISLPFDNVKTKYQKMVRRPDGNFPYSSFFDCFAKTLKYEGFLGYFIGFGTYVVRVAPHCIITLLVTDFLNRFFNS